MYRDFEGKTEEEAVEKAIEELGLEKDNFDVEILESKKGFFKKASVKIRVYYNTKEEVEEDKKEEDEEIEEEEASSSLGDDGRDIEEDIEKKSIEFLTSLFEKMGYPAEVKTTSKKDGKLNLDISGKYSSIIIGKQGKNLDAIQLIANVYIAKFDPSVKIILDVENYRIRHEENIIRNAYRVAEKVRATGRSKLLDPMNPFERRLVHTALNDFDGVDTKSEGDGLYKQVRIIPIKRQ